VWVLEGRLDLTDDRTPHRLEAGDCLRFRLWGATRFHNPGPGAVRYVVFVVLP
jgi:uncharacterized cupin superfamily protein